jgi:dTDP-4-dehydrorhamnose 3,5-epimerase
MTAIRNTLIEGVIIVPLKQIEDDRGAVLHMLRADSPVFDRFGEVYFSEVNYQAVKAWKRHQRMTQNFAVPTGTIKLVIYDDRDDSPTRGNIERLIIGRPDNYVLVRIPPGLWYGFQGLDEQPSLIANCADMPHDPEESEQKPMDDPSIPFAW